eukprot:320728-Pyramimonas_sp.AAC.1
MRPALSRPQSSVDAGQRGGAGEGRNGELEGGARELGGTGEEEGGLTWRRGEEEGRNNKQERGRWNVTKRTPSRCN